MTRLTLANRIAVEKARHVSRILDSTQQHMGRLALFMEAVLRNVNKFYLYTSIYRCRTEKPDVHHTKPYHHYHRVQSYLINSSTSSVKGKHIIKHLDWDSALSPSLPDPYHHRPDPDWQLHTRES